MRLLLLPILVCCEIKINILAFVGYPTVLYTYYGRGHSVKIIVGDVASVAHRRSLAACDEQHWQRRQQQQC